MLSSHTDAALACYTAKNACPVNYQVVRGKKELRIVAEQQLSQLQPRFQPATPWQKPNFQPQLMLACSSTAALHPPPTAHPNPPAATAAIPYPKSPRTPASLRHSCIAAAPPHHTAADPLISAARTKAPHPLAAPACDGSCMPPANGHARPCSTPLSTPRTLALLPGSPAATRRCRSPPPRAAAAAMQATSKRSTPSMYRAGYSIIPMSQAMGGNRVIALVKCICAVSTS